MSAVTIRVSQKERRSEVLINCFSNKDGEEDYEEIPCIGAWGGVVVVSAAR